MGGDDALVPGALPSESTSFIGRRDETAQVKAALAEHRLVTVVGPGGAGKTRLALETASRVARSYAGGCWFVDLGRDPAHRRIVDSVASALRLSRESGQWTVQELAARLGPRRLLLVLDNCEHVVDEVADLVRELLRASGAVVVLATSRQALGVSGEQLVHLDGLAFPPEGGPVERDDLAVVESVALFVERGRAIVPGLELTAENAGAVADIARRLEGLPLAIELAAARLRVLAPQQIANRLGDQFRLLRSSRVVDERHRALRTTIQWSYDLCTRAERLCWARLSVFPADFDLEAAEAVARGGDVAPEAVLELVEALIDKSVLRSASDRAEKERYRFTDPVRQFGREELAALESRCSSRDRHLEHFSQMATVVPEVLFGPRQVERTALLRTERANLEAALVHALEQAQVDAADTLACATALVSFTAGSLSESCEVLGKVLDRPSDRSRARVQVLWLSAWVAINQGDHALARRRADDARRMAQLLDDEAGLAHALQYLSQCELLRGNVSAAAEHARRALLLARESGDAHLLATSLVPHAQVLEALGRVGEAREALVESLAASDGVGERWCRGFTEWNLAMLLQATGRPGDGLAAARELLDSKALFEEAVGIAQGLEVMAWCSADLGQAARAAVLLGAADAAWSSSGAVLPPRLLARRSDGEARVVTDLGVEQAAALRREGQGLPPDDAVAWARESSGSALSAAPAPSAAAVVGPQRRDGTRSPLTAREHEVALLVAEGYRDREIADSLVISTRTAETHVAHILAKLGFTSRAQIGSWVGRRRSASGALRQVT